VIQSGRIGPVRSSKASSQDSRSRRPAVAKTSVKCFRAASGNIGVALIRVINHVGDHAAEFGRGEEPHWSE
jgi:hypothetical protein